MNSKAKGIELGKLETIETVKYGYSVKLHIHSRRPQTSFSCLRPVPGALERSFPERLLIHLAKSSSREFGLNRIKPRVQRRGLELVWFPHLYLRTRTVYVVTGHVLVQCAAPTLESAHKPWQIAIMQFGYKSRAYRLTSTSTSSDSNLVASSQSDQ